MHIAVIFLHKKQNKTLKSNNFKNLCRNFQYK